MTDLSGKVALVTGAASGIGLATVRRLLAGGAAVHLVDRDRPRLEEALASLGDGVAGSAADVTDEDAVSHAVAAATERFGPIDLLFSNAGIPGAHAPVADYPRAAFAEVLDVHVVGSFLACKHALAAMRDGGSIVLCSSVVGLRGAPNSAAYSTAKHALVGLARSLAKEVAPRGIRVNTIHPGPTDTAFQRGIEVAATGLDEEAAGRAFDAMIPLNRHGEPGEIGELVAFLASDASRFITGAALAIDGGMSA